MLKIIRKSHVGKKEYDFVTIYHHFSFGDFYDRNRMGIGPLRVLNVERFIPNSGYDTHHHKEIEILNYVYKGVLNHKDSMGNESTIEAGGLQYLRCGTGLEHSEWNHQDQSLRMVSLWFEPKKKGLKPQYFYHQLSKEEMSNKLVKVASYKDDAHMIVNQDVQVFLLHLDEEHYKEFRLMGSSEVYLFQISGESYINGKQIYSGDAIYATETLHIQPITPIALLIVELY